VKPADAFTLVLLFTAFLVMVFGTDHPAGKWADRHQLAAAHMPAHVTGHEATANLEADEEKLAAARAADAKAAGKYGAEKDGAAVSVAPASADAHAHTSSLDTAVNEPLTLRSAGRVLGNPLTWLPALAYFTTFGYELAIDANLANVLYALYKTKTFTQTQAGYVRMTRPRPCDAG
jgi:NNP family nitrate/nitrite transporter-like MFS transporter